MRVKVRIFFFVLPTNCLLHIIFNRIKQITNSKITYCAWEIKCPKMYQNENNNHEPKTAQLTRICHNFKKKNQSSFEECHCGIRWTKVNQKNSQESNFVVSELKGKLIRQQYYSPSCTTVLTCCNLTEIVTELLK